MSIEQTDTLVQQAAPPASSLVAAPAAPTPPPLTPFHLRGVTLTVYQNLLGALFDNNHPAMKSAGEYVFDLFARFQPRDAVEELLVSQMIQTQIRITSLTSSAQAQKNLAWAKMMYEAADRASNTFRRQMLALSEYRNPKKPATVTTIEQANIAQQQVVQNHPPAAKTKKATNELGCAAQSNANEVDTIDRDIAERRSKEAVSTCEKKATNELGCAAQADAGTAVTRHEEHET